MSEIIKFIIMANFIILIIYYKRTKNIFNIAYIIQIFILLNVFMYFEKWSYFISKNPCTEFYIVIISLMVIFYISLISSKKINYEKVPTVRYINSMAVYVLNIIYCISMFLESYIATGTVIPTLKGIDNHTLSVPILNIITRNMGLIFIINYLYICVKKKKSIIIFLINFIYIFNFLFLRCARMVIVVGLLEFGLFYFIYNYKKLSFKKIMSSTIFAVLLILVSTIIGNYRMSDFGKYKVSYTNAILYNGPKDKLGLISSYYGYFPMSFENLNLSIQKANSLDSCTYGLNSLAPILVGIFKFNDIFTNYPYLNFIRKNSVYNVLEATVPTGFLEFYLDFKSFIIIPLLFYLRITIYFYNRINKNIIYLFCYSVFSVAWAMMTFQNLLILPTTLYQILIFVIFSKLFIKLKGGV